ncbi:glycoside hydrolase family 3 C-terminal domain-containing protein [Tessaracoccus lacteus]|uniref:Glycoside hydrolase family 3 C-terminal domain-containing protein n=1 Tax=Tessaracoccus lacteus TaxID=3041766 RepID=A0ABY8PV82_9ACTN|nr:glycoside hydrolase family 3 C-terminal domain-containing protein [Tessaracoccus sp. T21]WGT46340.1 glycoside hydrolase family 3 C-terminal domain-containing protein [Tessaracoccus sp. T21]
MHTPDPRVETLLKDLSRADLEAIALGDFAPLEARGLPAPDYVDSGTGLRGVDGATAFPCGTALAATFDEGLAERYGRAVGVEARRAGFPVVLGPTVDLARDPVGGRVGEAFGEDPFLSGLIGAAHVVGLQSAHVIAQVKHYVAYNGEARRTGFGRDAERGDSMDVAVDDATLHDVYLRPFEAAVRAGALSMMGSYNRVGGAYVCEDADLLDIPRRLWGWEGFYCPDFIFAVRDPARALAAGLDLGALGGAGGRTADLVAEAPEETLRALVRHLVHALVSSGLVDDPLPTPGPPSSPDHLALAREVAVAGSVLLRNDGVLPLGAGLRRVAVIGPAADDALYVGGGAASVTLTPERLVTPVDALAARLDAEVVTAQGSLGDGALPVVPASAWQLPDGSGPGVLVEFADGDTVEHELVDRIDHQLPPGATRWPRLWRARLLPPVDGAHRISLSFGGQARLRIGSEIVIDACREAERFIHGPLYPAQAVVRLTAGVPVDVEIDYDNGPAIEIPPMGITPTLRLGWQPPDGLIDEAVALASGSDVAVVVVNAAAGEGMDRDGLALPGDQDELVARVAAANPRTVVVVNAPGAVLMPWAEDVAAIVQVWYPGEQFGPALADILSGDREPGGRLPLTIPFTRGQLPGSRSAGEVPKTLYYTADGGIGYRSPAVLAEGAAFPFGFGLGYSGTEATASARADGDSLTVTVTATNLGGRPTCHVAQVYVSADGVGARELAGVVRIPLDIGATAAGSVTIDPPLRWDAAAGRRLPLAGAHTVAVAQHSADPGTVFTFDGRRREPSAAPVG